MPNIKNRSSKQLIPQTKCKDVYRSMSNSKLNAFNTESAAKERARRKAKHDKKAKAVLNG